MRKLKLLLALCMATIAASASKTVYLAPGAWDVANTTEYFALWAWPEGGDGQWAVREDVGLGVYKFTFDDSCQKMFFLRTSADEDYWNNEWARTGEITVPSTDDVLYTINSTEDNSYSESSYSFYTSIRALSEGKYYLKNVASGKFWGAGNSWGTQASLVEHPEYVTLHPYISDGHYTLESQVSNGGTAYFFEGDYMDNGNAYWLRVAKKDDNKFTFSKADGTDNTYFGYDGSTTVLGKGLAATSENALWEVYSEAEMIANLSAATANSPLDATFFILDPNFGRNNRYQGSWTMEASNKNLSGGNNVNNCAESYHSVFTLSQTLSNVPNGVYRMTAQGFYRQDGSDNTNLPYFYINDEKQTFSAMGTLPDHDGSKGNSMGDASVEFTNGNYTIDPVFVKVENGTITLGAKLETNTTLWCIFDNFVLTYFGDCTIAEAQNAAHILDYNEALANAQAAALKPMAASAKSTLEGIIDANDDLDTATATAQELIDATTALNNAVTAAQSSIDLYESIKSLETQLKVQQSDFSVDTKYNAGEYTALSEVYADFNAFAIAKLSTDANTDYTSAIVNPSFEFGNTIGWTYDPSNDHGAKTYAMSGKDGEYIFNIWSAGHTVKQTIVGLPKGLYELKAVVANDGAKVYLIANDAHEGIQCSGADDGVEGSVKVAVANGSLTIGASGCNNDSEKTFSEVGVWWYKADNFRLTYLGDVVSDEDAAALLATVPTGKMNAEVETALNNAKSAFEASKTTDNYSALQTAIEHATASIEAYAHAKSAIDEAKDIQANTNVVTAAAATTFADAIAAIETPYNNGTLSTDEANNAGTVLGVSASGWHANPNGAAGKYMESAWDNADNFGDYYINTWSNEGANDGSNFVVPFFEYWTGDANSLGAKTMTATQENLAPNGIYSVSVWARARQANNKTKVAGSITLQVGEGTAVDMTTGTQIGSSQFYLDTFTATGQADADGKLTIKINVAAESNVSWLSFKNVKYTEVESASTDDYAALAAAITAAEANTLGFEAGEYAPYNNIEAMKALAAAKAIDANAVNAKEDVTAATTALTAATWTENTEEVNAIYDGSFNLTPNQMTFKVGNNDVTEYVPLGWTNLGYNTRVYKDASVNAGVAAASQGAAMMAKFTTEYGTEAGYTMPLKAGEYELNFIYGGWNEVGTRDIKIYCGGTQATVTPVTVTAKDNKAHTTVDSWASYKGSVIIPADGDYVLSFFRESTTSQNQIAISDIVLKKAPVYAVVGTASFFSGSWDKSTTTDILTLENGVYTKTYANQELEAQTIEFKVIKKASVDADAADTWYGNSEGNNIEMVIAEVGTYDITINFDGSNISYVLTPLTETFNVTTAGWATAITHNAVDFTGVESLKAYTATVAEGVVTLAEAGAVPAGTALVLKGATKAVPIVESAAAVENDLKGSNEYDYVISDEMDAQYNFYGLTVSGETAKFAKLNKGTIQPGKAYLQIEKPATGGARELKVVFAGDATGIDAVVAEKAVEGIYNMNGQRVTAPAKGLYIVNGKKVVLK